MSWKLHSLTEVGLGVFPSCIGIAFCMRKLMCYDFEQLSDSSLYLCSVLSKLSIVYSRFTGSRFNLSSPRMPLVSGIV